MVNKGLLETAWPELDGTQYSTLLHKPESAIVIKIDQPT